MRLRRWLVGCLGIIVVMMIAAPAFAEGEGDVIFKKHTVVDFGDDTIDGSLSKPDGAYLESRKNQRHARLIKVRESFRTEILMSVRGL